MTGLTLAVPLSAQTPEQLLGQDKTDISGRTSLTLGSGARAFGMGGAFISLAMSKWLAKMSVGAQVITEPRGEAEQWLLATVRRHAENAGIGMPDERLDELNELLAAPDPAPPGSAAGMGLFVVARLAQRHGVRVQSQVRPVALAIQTQ